MVHTYVHNPVFGSICASVACFNIFYICKWYHCASGITGAVVPAVSRKESACITSNVENLKIFYG